VKVRCCACEIWGLLAEEGFQELIFVACRSDANSDLRIGIWWEEAMISAGNDNRYFESLTALQSLRKAHQLSPEDLWPDIMVL
jgi:hypothetical protein